MDGCGKGEEDRKYEAEVLECGKFESVALDEQKSASRGKCIFRVCIS